MSIRGSDTIGSAFQVQSSNFRCSSDSEHITGLRQLSLRAKERHQIAYRIASEAFVRAAGGTFRPGPFGYLRAVQFRKSNIDAAVMTLFECGGETGSAGCIRGTAPRTMKMDAMECG
jgi:hypothetical protein